MSVITQRGDSGETDLLFGRRVSKTHPRVVANGAIDELNALLGVARWHARNEHAEVVEERLGLRQAQLITIMGQVATLEEDRERYERDGFQSLDPSAVIELTNEAKALEAALDERFRDWVVPGSRGTLASAQLDHARSVCRRAEHLLYAIPDAGDSLRQGMIYLNRLGDYLWILARARERNLAPERLSATTAEREMGTPPHGQDD